MSSPTALDLCIKYLQSRIHSAPKEPWTEKQNEEEVAFQGFSKGSPAGCTYPSEPVDEQWE